MSETEMRNSGFVYIGFLNGFEMLKQRQQTIYYIQEKR